MSATRSWTRHRTGPSRSASIRAPAHGTAPLDRLPEVQLRIGVRSPDKSSVERFTREIAPLILNGPPSVTGFAGGRPKPEEIVAYWPALLDKQMVAPCVEVVEV